MSDYQREFRELGMRLMDRLGREDWEDIHKRLVHWDLELAASGDTGMAEVLRMQKQDAGRQFARFVTDHYGGWLADSTGATIRRTRCSPQGAVGRREAPFGRGAEDPAGRDRQFPVRSMAVAPVLNAHYQIQSERFHWSFLPTATQYARNAMLPA